MVNQKKRAIALTMLVKVLSRTRLRHRGNPGRGRVCALAQPDQSFGEPAIRMHRDVTGDVVKDVGFRQVIQLVATPDGDGGWKLAVPQTIEKEKRRHITANGLGLKSGPAWASTRLMSSSRGTWSPLNPKTSMPLRKRSLA